MDWYNMVLVVHVDCTGLRPLFCNPLYFNQIKFLSRRAADSVEGIFHFKVDPIHSAGLFEGDIDNVSVDDLAFMRSPKVGGQQKSSAKRKSANMRTYFF
jgi:hypothetical protein